MTTVTLCTSLIGAMIQCYKCGHKWFDNYYIVNGHNYCMDCGDPIIEPFMKEEAERQRKWLEQMNAGCSEE
jgi:hypothetical protein